MDVGNLIETVRQFPHLWDKKDPKYSDSLANENAWETISQIAEVSVEDCKVSWKNIRDRYVKERRLSTKRPTGSQPYTVRWPFYKLCNFLDATIKKRKTVGNIKKVSQTSGYTPGLWQDMHIGEDGTLIENEETENSLRNEIEEENEGPSNENSSGPSTENSSDTVADAFTEPADSQEHTKKTLVALKKDRNETRRKNVSTQDIDKLVEKSLKVGESIEELVSKVIKEGNGNENEDHHFALSVEASLGRIADPKRRLRIKAKMLLLLADEDD